MFYYYTYACLLKYLFHIYYSSKLKNFNKNYKGFKNDRKRKETRGDTDRTIILFLDPLIFNTKIPRD